MHYKKLIMAATFCGVAAAGSMASAASVTWGTPFELASATDIDLTYPVVYALNAGDTTNNARILTGTAPTSPLVVTIGGKTVSFDGVEAKYGADAIFGIYETFGDATSNLAGGPENVTFSVVNYRTAPLPQVSVDKFPTNVFATEGRVYTPTTGNAELDIILNSQVFFDGRGIGSSALNISLNNLTPGHEYQVQIIGAADSRTGSNVPSVVTLNDGAGNSVAGLSGYADLNNDTILHVTSVLGTFTADGTSQPINAVLEAKRNGGVSAIVLTAIPEPASLGALSLVATFLRRRR